MLPSGRFPVRSAVVKSAGVQLIMPVVLMLAAGGVPGGIPTIAPPASVAPWQAKHPPVRARYSPSGKECRPTLSCLTTSAGKSGSFPATIERARHRAEGPAGQGAVDLGHRRDVRHQGREVSVGEVLVFLRRHDGQSAMVGADAVPDRAIPVGQRPAGDRAARPAGEVRGDDVPQRLVVDEHLAAQIGGVAVDALADRGGDVLSPRQRRAVGGQRERPGGAVIAAVEAEDGVAVQGREGADDHQQESKKPASQSAH